MSLAFQLFLPLDSSPYVVAEGVVDAVHSEQREQL